MDLPGIPGAIDNEAWEKAQKRQQELLESLKKAVKATVREVGVLRSEMQVTVPAGVIAEHMEQNYDELMHDAFVPGFRRGRAPRKLIEKRFGAEVRESLASSLIGQAFFAAAENEKLDVLGDPLFSVTTDDGGVKLMAYDEAIERLKLPESGDFTFTCEVELKPAFELPELKGIPVKTPTYAITDAMVDAWIMQRRTIRGHLAPVADGGAQRNDHLVADVVLQVDGQEVWREDNVLVNVRPTQLQGITMPELDQVLLGVKPGDVRTADCTITDDYERADLRGKRGQFAFTVHEVKRLAPEPMDDFLKVNGFEDEQEARTFARERLEVERDEMVERARREQIHDYLLANTSLDLPEGLSARQTGRAVLRKVVDLQKQGVPYSEIEARIDELRTSAKSEVVQSLKLGFILDEAADKLEIDATDEEINDEIARMAHLYNRRFDRMREELQSRGLLDQLITQIRHDKCADRLLEDAATDQAQPDADVADTK